MNEARENWALIAFTSLGPLSVGGFIGALCAGAIDTGVATLAPIVVMLAVGILALGASLLHLGRPLRAPLALVNWSSSWLSREVILFGLYLAGLTLVVLASGPDVRSPATWLLAALSGVLGLFAVFATGKVYELRSRPVWDHWASAAAFPLSAGSGGLLLGLAVAQMSSSTVGIGATLPLFGFSVLCLILGVWATWFRLRGATGRSEEVLAGFRLAFGQYRWAVVIRFAGALCALGLIALGGTASMAAWIPAVLGEIADRVLFFCTAVPVSLSARSGVRPFGRVIRESRTGWGRGGLG